MKKQKMKLTRQKLKIAENEISLNDKVMAKCIQQLGPLKPQEQRDPFDAIIVSIINQQISQAAAATIVGRVSDITKRPFNVKNILSAKNEDLRKSGMSQRKVDYAKGIADNVKCRYKAFF